MVFDEIIWYNVCKSINMSQLLRLCRLQITYAVAAENALAFSIKRRRIISLHIASTRREETVSYTIMNNIDYKVGIYIRLSREDEEKEKYQESESIGNQRTLLMQYIRQNKLNFISEYVDDGVSGTSFDRPAFNRMIADIESR